jgi:hypothetical protein
MAFSAFFYAIWYIQTHATVEEPVLWFLGFIVALWALGRASFTEALAVVKEWIAKK